MATQRSSDVAWEGLIYYKQKATFMSVSADHLDSPGLAGVWDGWMLHILTHTVHVLRTSLLVKSCKWLQDMF